MTVNLFHDLGVVEKAPPAADVKQPENEQVWKTNVSQSQVIRLQKRAADRAEKAKLEEHKTKARIEAEKANNQQFVSDALEATSHAEKSKLEAEKARCDAKETKIEAKKAITEAKEEKRSSKS